MLVKFREMLINEFYGKIENYPLALALYQLSWGKGDIPETIIQIQEAGEREYSRYQATDIMELMDMLEFFEEVVEVDESSITRFMEYYREEMLRHVLGVAEKEKFLDEKMKRNMKILYERIKS